MTSKETFKYKRGRGSSSSGRGNGSRGGRGNGGRGGRGNWNRGGGSPGGYVRQGSARVDLRILSWNVHGLSRGKLEDSDFINQFDKGDIIFIYETWADKDSQLDISGFQCINLYRKFQNRRAKRCSGGVAVYIRNEVSNGVKLIKSVHDSIVWLKLDRDFFENEDDIYVAGAYIWVENSPAYNVVNCDFFELLQTDITQFQDIGKVVICGDLNARVGQTRSDYIVYDRVVDYIDNGDYIPDNPPPRASMDSSTNSHGLKLIDLCRSTSMRIVNGRLHSDLSGSFTYANRMGSSVIDYLLVHENDFYIINDFRVGHFNEWSDHAPLLYEVRCGSLEMGQNEENSGNCNKFVWNDLLKDTFRKNLISKLPELNNLMQNVDPSSNESLNSTTNSFTDIIRGAADPLFSREQKSKSNVMYQNPNKLCKKADWFDDECVTAKLAYKTALYQFNRCKNSLNRVSMCTAKESYKRLIRKKKRKSELIKLRQIENLRNSKPRDFWKLFTSKKTKQSNINLNDFYKYFSQLNDDLSGTTVPEAEEFCASGADSCDDPSFEELDIAITFEEIETVIKALKRSKSSGLDGLLNEYFMESYDIIGGHLVDLFNAILNSGHFPDSWSVGILVPLHKKGDFQDPNNYRGITLVSCLAKIFTGVLNSRMSKWVENNDVISDSQFGFRSGRSTVDAIFVLNAVVQKILNEKGRLYCAFIDLKKAFDSIYLNGLWYKLSKLGVDGKLFNIVRNMYNCVKTCVQGCNTYSEFFECAVGLRQGEVMSPMLFSLFIEDLELFLQNEPACGLSIDDITFILMLFADDMVIFGSTPQDLQNSLDMLKSYCDKWSLTVNTSKTKIMVFRKRGSTRQNEKWTYGGDEIDIVNDFNYLGTVFNYTGNFALNQEYLAGKGLKALNVLIAKIKQFQFKPKTVCQLFDAFVGSTLSYASEVWGNTKSKEVERIHLKFCKQLLHVKTSTCNMAVYGELGRYPLYVNRYTRMIKYWCKIIQSDNIIIRVL